MLKLKLSNNTLAKKSTKTFLKKIKTYEDFRASKSNSAYRVVVTLDTVFIDEIEIRVRGVPAVSIFSIQSRLKTSSGKEVVKRK